MIKPKRLKIGDTIGIVAPASPASKEKIERACERLSQIGFNVVVGDNCHTQYGYLTADDKERAQELNSMFANKAIDGIICLRGGYGTPRILDLLDYELIRNNPKVFVGYSDISCLHIAFNKYSNLVTFHGPMLTSDMAGDFSDFSMNSLLNSISNEEFNPLIRNATEEMITINEGIAEGEIIGGNLSLIVSTLGTPYEIDTKGKILFIEEIGEYTYKIDRMLTQLRLAKKLEEAEGIILGNFNKCLPEGKDDFTLEEVFDQIIRPLNKPAIYNLQAGHCEPVVTIPFGVEAKLDANKREIILLERPTLG